MTGHPHPRTLSSQVYSIWKTNGRFALGGLPINLAANVVGRGEAAWVCTGLLAPKTSPLLRTRRIV